MPGGLQSIPGDLNVGGNAFIAGNWTVNGNSIFSGTLALTGNFTFAGQVLAAVDNAVDIGAFGASRPRNLFVGSTIFTTAPRANAAGAYIVAATDNTIINSVASTLTLPAVATSTGRKLRVVTTGANAIISNAANVVPITGGAAGTAILAATAGKWADLECDGANWIITAQN